MDSITSKIINVSDADSCKATCLAFTGCRSVGWTQASGTCSLYDHTRIQVGMDWKPSPGDHYFEFYFSPLGKTDGWFNNLKTDSSSPLEYHEVIDIFRISLMDSQSMMTRLFKRKPGHLQES